MAFAGKALIPRMILLVLFGFFQTTQAMSQERDFKTSFEYLDDFVNFYITPQAHLGSTYHEQSDDKVLEGRYSHKAWITKSNPNSTWWANNNHRGYPTIQLYKTAAGAFSTPSYITLWVWLDMPLHSRAGAGEDDWFSFATFTDDESDRWARTVLVNLSHEGFVHLMHVPHQGGQSYEYQTDSLTFPQQQWVKLTVYLDFRDNGYAKVWQDGVLVSHAKVSDTQNRLAQAHFGLYASPHIETGVVYNDDIVIKEVAEE